MNGPFPENIRSIFATSCLITDMQYGVKRDILTNPTEHNSYPNQFPPNQFSTSLLHSITFAGVTILHN